MRNRFEIWIVFAVLLAAFAAQGLFSMSRQSATSDEIPHLAAGYSYIKTGDYRLNYEHPPLVKLIAALPLFALNLDFNQNLPAWKQGEEWSFGEEFINNNRVPAKTIVFWGRVPMLALALLLGFVIFRWTSEIYGPRAGLTSLLLYAFCPNMLANAPLVTFDVPNALFTLASVYTFYRMLLRPDTRRILYAGGALGLALSCKATAVDLLPLYVFLAAVFFWKRGTKGAVLAKVLTRTALTLLTAAAVILVTYQVTSFPHYLESLKYFVRDVGKGGRPAFLFGHYSLHGWWYYFLAAIAIKTPVPSLLLVGVAFASLARCKRPVLVEYFLVIPVVFFLVLASLSRLQLGLRYVLQIYPFLFIFAGGRIWMMVDRMARWRRAVTVALAGLLVWYVAGTLRVSPHYLAYFNDLVGGPRNGYKYLLDSNLDWGQDLPALAGFLDANGRPEVVLSYFGTASPRTYGITYQDFFSYNRSGRKEEHLNSLAPRREVFVISANLLQCLFIGDKHYYDWLKRKRPIAVPGHSLFVYDITGDADSHTRLGISYLGGNLLAKAEREFRRALAIDPASTQAMAYLDVVRQRSTGRSSD